MLTPSRPQRVLVKATAGEYDPATGGRGAPPGGQTISVDAASLIAGIARKISTTVVRPILRRRRRARAARWGWSTRSLGRVVAAPRSAARHAAPPPCAEARRQTRSAVERRRAASRFSGASDASSSAARAAAGGASGHAMPAKKGCARSVANSPARRRAVTSRLRSACTSATASADTSRSSPTLSPCSSGGAPRRSARLSSDERPRYGWRPVNSSHTRRPTPHQSTSSPYVASKTSGAR